MEMNYLYVGTLIVTLIYIARMRFNSRKQDRRNNERRMCFQHRAPCQYRR